VRRRTDPAYDELVARPERTPEALLAALALVAPARLSELRRTQEKARAKAAGWRSSAPVRSWLPTWARDIKIARRSDLRARHDRATGNLEHKDATVALKALRELTAVLDEALNAVRG
jgi:hypothetical protein